MFSAGHTIPLGLRIVMLGLGIDEIWDEIMHDASIKIAVLSFQLIYYCIAHLLQVVPIHLGAQHFTSEVLKDALNRETFLGYDTRLRSL
jgi:uncharacterized membrane protein